MKRDGHKYTWHLIQFGIILFIALFSASCKTGSSVSDKKLVQKRKYQKGFYVNVKNPFGKNQKPKAKYDDAEILAEKKLEEISIPQIEEQWQVEILEIDTNSLLNNESYLELEASTGADLPPDVFEKKTFHFDKIQSLDEATLSPQNTNFHKSPRLNTVALLGFIAAVLSLFTWGILLSLVAMVLGIIGIIQVAKYPDEYRGMGFAITALSIGFIGFVIKMIFLAFMLSYIWLMVLI